MKGKAGRAGAFRRHISLAHGNLHLHLERAGPVQMRYNLILIQENDSRPVCLHGSGGQFDGGSENGTFSVTGQRSNAAPEILEGSFFKDQAFDVQFNFFQALLYAGDHACFRVHSGNRNMIDGDACQGRKHQAFQGIPQRRAIAPGQGFSHKFTIRIVFRKIQNPDFGFFKFQHRERPPVQLLLCSWHFTRMNLRPILRASTGHLYILSESQACCKLFQECKIHFPMIYTAACGPGNVFRAEFH